MRRLMLAAAMAATLPVCAVQAQSTAEVTLSPNDPKFDTPRCRAARQRAGQYAEATGKGRFLVQFVWWAALGAFVPPGTYDPTPEQQAINRDLRRHCVSGATRRR